MGRLGKDSISCGVEGDSTLCEMEGDSNINRDREILGSESDGSFNLLRDLSGQRTFLFSPRPSSPRAAPLFFLFLLQPRSMELAEFLVIG